jgi:hypothetical protein
VVGRAIFGAVLGLALLGSGCSKKHPDAAKLTLPAPPKDVPLRLDIQLGGALELLGARLEPSSGLKPGSRTELTLYWQKRAAIPRGFRLFTHVLDEAGERVQNLDGVGPLRKSLNGELLLPPSAWDEDVVYVDKLSFMVPIALRTDSFSVVAGLYREDERLPVTKGPKAQLGRDHAVVLVAPVTRPVKAAQAVPLLWVPHRKKGWEIVIDGKLDEPSWGGSANTGQLVNVGTGEAQAAADVTGSARMIYDDEQLFIGFEIFDDELRGGFQPDLPDQHLWTRDSVEVLIDPDGDGDGLDYYEIQINPQNLVFDSQFDAYNSPKVEPNGPFGHQEWSSHVKSAVTLRGTLDDGEEDEGYVVEMAIPWSSLSKAKRAPPKYEDVWRMNLYAVQNNTGAAWSPILGQGNFPRASRFGRVRFGK